MIHYCLWLIFRSYNILRDSYISLSFAVSDSAKELKKIKTEGRCVAYLENMQGVEMLPLLFLYLPEIVANMIDVTALV